MRAPRSPSSVTESSAPTKVTGQMPSRKLPVMEFCNVRTSLELRPPDVFQNPAVAKPRGGNRRPERRSLFCVPRSPALPRD